MIATDGVCKILSVENWEPPASWSWGIVINALIGYMGEGYRFTRIKRGIFQCGNPRCQQYHFHAVDKGLAQDYDIIFPHNPDSVRLMPENAKVVCRVGGLNMQNPERERYQAEFAKVSAVIATNDELAEIARQANPNVTVIPNGVDLEHFKPADPNPNFDRPITIGFAGNIWGPGSEYKGWKFFVEASIKLQIACGAQSMHLLHGGNQIPHDQMPTEFYHKIDALILPSKGEGCSNVVTEALACGVPPILTKVGFHGERLTDGVNCLFIERDVDELIGAVVKLNDNRELRTNMCREARAFAVKHHDIREVARMYDEVFQGVLSRQ